MAERTLRLGFAMGGGVSLGSFQGGALSQAIKLAVAHAGYTDENHKRVPYDRVEIDVFSGASAGAMSLAIMLAGLIKPRGDTEAMKAAAKASLLADPQIGQAAFDALIPARQDDLIAAQIVQDVQNDVWTTPRLGIERLVGRGGGSPRSLANMASLLDRGVLEAVGKEILIDPPLGPLPALLAKRVLFACTLTNLTPIVTDARADVPGDAFGYVALRDGLRCKVHREVRVFDMHFTDLAGAIAGNGGPPDKEDLPARWCRFQAGPVPGPAQAPLLLRGDLTPAKADSWRTICATAVACGAFPFAFEPVPLTRYREEFGNTWPGELENRADHVFTYIDGGTLNNEPIREAFRLASYIDALTPDIDFDRKIIFCTPSGADELMPYRLPVHQQVNFPDLHPLLSARHLQPQRRATLDRLVPHAGTILTALIDEGRNQEDNKIVLTRNRFDERDRMRNFLALTLAGPSPEAFKALLDYCSATLTQDRKNSMIPPTPLGLIGELQRVIWEWRATQGIPDDATAQALSTRTRGTNFVQNLAAQPDALLWLQLLSFVALDLVLDLNGKFRDAELLAIGPFDNLRLVTVKDPITGQDKLDPATGDLLLDAQQKPIVDPLTGLAKKDPATQKPLKVPDADPITLSAGELAAFSGFLSPAAMRTAFDVGKHCALGFLNKATLIDRPDEPNVGGGPASDDAAYRADLKNKIHFLADRVAEVVQTNALFSLPLLDGTAKSIIAGAARDRVTQLQAPAPAGVSHEMRVHLPSDHFRLAGGGVGDVAPITVDDADGASTLSLVTFGRYLAADQSWFLGHLFGNGDLLQVNAPGLLGSGLFESSFCSCELPPVSDTEGLNVNPYPIWSIDLALTDKHGRVSAARWAVEPAVRPLDQSLGR